MAPATSSDNDRSAVKVALQQLFDRMSAVTDRIDWETFLELAEMLPRVRRTYVTGAGRSGLVARSFAMRLMHAGLPAFIPGETISPAAGTGDLLVAISCTGKTGYTDYMCRRARELGAQVVVITANADSPLARDADKVVLIPAPADAGIVIQGEVFEHVTMLCLDSVFSVLSKQLKVDLDSFRKRHANLE